MKSKIIIGSIQNEGNTLNPVLTEYEDFSVFFGAEMESKVSVADHFRAGGYEVIPTFYANTLPSGPVSCRALDHLTKNLLDSFPKDLSDVAGVWLYLHGSMVVEDLRSGDEHILKAVRALVGPNIPIALAMDLHAGVTDELVTNANIICGYRTAPHVDIERTELHAADLLMECIASGELPNPYVIQIPVLAWGDSLTTDVAPGKTVIDKLWQLEKEYSLRSLAIFISNPWVDNAAVGAAVVATPGPGVDGEQNARKAAADLAQLYWDVRKDYAFRAPIMEPEAAIEYALNSTVSPLFISDTGDNTTGGAPGDSAYFLKMFLDRQIQGAFFTNITDSHVINQCENMKPGDAASFVLGGSLDPSSTSITVTATLKARANVPCWGKGDPIPAVLLTIEGNDVVITQKRFACIYANIFEMFGVKMQEYRYVVIKLGYLFAEIHAIAPDSIMALTPGATYEYIERCGFHNFKAPAYPYDTDFEWSPPR